MNTFWQYETSDLLARLKVDPQNGLSDGEAAERLKVYGSTIAKTSQSLIAVKLFVRQFNSPLIYMLLFAAGVSLFLYESTDALIILGIITISTCLSFFQEWGAVRSMEKLLDLVKVKALVIRNGAEIKVPIEEVVPGDIILLQAGDIIPGDCSLLETNNLFVDEAALTGESYFSEKSPGIIGAEAPIPARSNALFMGTHVASGTARALVVLTGSSSEFGKIAESLKKTRPEAEFEKGIRKFSYLLLEITFILLIVIFAINIFLDRPVIESLLFALAISIGLTPQLLPAVITINLAYGAKLMAKSEVIVKKLASIENFGSMNILCSDKTGTLTTGEINLVNACGADGQKNDKTLFYAYLNAFFQQGYANPIDHAIITYAPIGLEGWKKLDEVPYDFNRKRLSLLVQKDNTRLIVTKGAWQQILAICTKAETKNGTIVPVEEITPLLTKVFSDFCGAGYRVLGICYSEVDTDAIGPIQEEGMTFLGFLIFEDPIKSGSKETIEQLRSLGINLKIITGDNKLAAIHAAKMLGISEKKIITGGQLQHLSDRALFHQVNQKEIFAEIEPNQKERIVLALKKAGNVVGFLGDGINDVTALHAADVGISVDSGADAAKEAADIVLLKKDLTVLQDGVMAGRRTFANTMKYIFMASSANFGNMFSMAGASLFLSFLPLLPKQVLLTNLMTDFPEMTIATDRVDDEMLKKPFRWNLSFIKKFMLVFGLISSIFDYITFGVLLGMHATVDQFRTGWFIESVVSATLIVLVIRTSRPFLLSRPSNYLLGTVLVIVVLALSMPFMPFADRLGFACINWKIYCAIAVIVAIYLITVEYFKRKFFR